MISGPLSYRVFQEAGPSCSYDNIFEFPRWSLTRASTALGMISTEQFKPKEQIHLSLALISVFYSKAFWEHQKRRALQTVTEEGVVEKLSVHVAFYLDFLGLFLRSLPSLPWRACFLLNCWQHIDTSATVLVP